MKIYGRVEITPPFLTLALDGGEWSASFPSCFILGEEPQYPLNIKFPVILITLHLFTEFHTKLHRSYSPKITNLWP
jgi:hypothetical protein